jgi:predicted phosphodiesterase
MSAMLLSRRQFLGAAAAAAAAPARALTPSQESLRAVFLTDAHLPLPSAEDAAKYRQQERARAAFRSAAARQPGLWLFGGDNVMAVDQGQTEEQAAEMFANWSRLVREEVKAPHASVIGNHDIWYPKEGAPEDRKAMAKQAFAMPHRYHRMDQGGWNFFMLDVFHESGPIAIDDEQFAWLDAELAKATGPCCVVSHTQFFGPAAQIEGGAVSNPKRTRELFLKHDNVRLALSGHQHHVDASTYDRVTYLCGGAVSSAWWGGNYAHFPPAYLVLDLLPDGEVNWETVFWETGLGEPPAVGEDGISTRL